MSAKLAVPAVAVLLGLNYVFNELMDESGLHITVLTASLESAKGNSSALNAFRAITDVADGMSDPSDCGALRFEISEDRQLLADGTPTIDVTFVHRQRFDQPALPAWLASGGLTLRSEVRLRTVFPERSRWRVVSRTTEPGSLADIGRIALLVQQVTHYVKADAIDAFRRSWTDLGYNALAEAGHGVLRCDLMQSDERSTTFVARKVFRHAAALKAHEASEHYSRWRQLVSPMMSGQDSPATLLDTVHPRTSIMPFRSRWTTE